MIVYFADKTLNILGQASTCLPKGIVIVSDKKVDEVETGISSFEFELSFDDDTRAKVEKWAAVGHYVLRNEDDECGLFTIIETEVDTKNQTMYCYAEDVGLDLLNEVVGEFSTTTSYDMTWYVKNLIDGTGFEVGTNKSPTTKKALKFNSDQTKAARLAAVAEEFDCELSFSFKVKNLRIERRFVNIYRTRGKDEGTTLYLNKHIDKIVINQSIANLATEMRCTGGTPEDSDDPITLKGYSYDDGDIYVAGEYIKSRKAYQKWSRYLWRTSDSQAKSGHITKLFDSQAETQAQLFKEAYAELKKYLDVEVNYDIEIKTMPEDVSIGDRVNIVDEKGELFLSSRILKLERSVCEDSYEATLGEHIIKPSGIHQKVLTLANKFQATAQSVARALQIAKNARTVANGAQTAADNAQTAANNAQTAADNAQTAADNATSAVEGVQTEINEMNEIIDDANEAAEFAKEAAEIAQSKAEESLAASEAAKTDAAAAQTAASEAKTASTAAVETANTAKTTAETAKNQATEASTVANAAKIDAEAAETEVNNLGKRLDSVSQTMEADYARKTELTETTANLQSQITQNAAQISLNVQSITTIDETANNAAELAAQAQETAAQAQTEAEEAAADALEAQTAADTAAQAASDAQAEADKAKTAAATAQEVANKADADLKAAEENLATISGRVDATEEDIAAAEQLVAEAQAAANKANEDAATATTKAEEAQTAADDAVSKAAEAQAQAADAVSKATTAQAAADAAKGDAAAAQAVANEAKTTALNAKTTADNAAADALNAQTKADNAAQTAASATQAAADAQAQADQAAADLETAKAELAEIEGKADATAEEVEKAKANVVIAQAAADEAKTNAANAQAAADAAQADAEAAQADADAAKQAAAEAQKAADDAQEAADKAQADVDSLEIRVIEAETSINQTNQQIELLATKKEVATSLGGYYTKDETEGRINTKADEINLSVNRSIENKLSDYYTKLETKSSIEIDNAINLSVSTTKEELTKKIDDIEIGSRNYAAVSKVNNYLMSDYSYNNYTWSGTHDGSYEGLQIAYTAFEAGQYVVSYTLTVTAGTLLGIGGGLGSNAVSKWYVNGKLMTSNYNISRTAAWSVPEADKYEVILYLNATGNDNLYIQPNRGSATSVTFSITDIMVEKGNKKSDWSPAPEDVEEKFTHYYTKTEVDTAIDVSKEGINLSVDTKIKNVKIGGKNLLKNSRMILLRSNNPDIYPIAYTQENEDERSFYRYTRTETTLSPTMMNLYSSIPLSDITKNLYGMEVTLSFLARTSHETTANLMHGMRIEGVSVNVGADKTYTLNSSWQRISLVTTIGVEYEKKSTNLLRFNPYIITIPDGEIDNFYLDVCEWKIEFGNKATDWTAAPEDIESEIDDATNKADNALEGLTEAKTQIALLTDSIEQLVRNGDTGTLIKQTSEGLYYFDISGLESAINSANTAITNLEGIVTDANGEIDLLKTAAEALQSRTEYVKSYTDENDQPCLELGEGDSVYKLFVTNTGILMMDGTDTPTKITNKQLDVTRAVIRTEMQIGDDLTPNTAGQAGVWMIKRRDNGNIGLIWKDVNE